MCNAVINKDNDIYQQALSRGSHFWSYVRVMTDKERVSYPSNHPKIKRYLNQLISENADQDWVGYINMKVCPAGTMCSLGNE